MLLMMIRIMTMLQWAERLLEGGGNEQWGDKWEERFKDGKGGKQVSCMILLRGASAPLWQGRACLPVPLWTSFLGTFTASQSSCPCDGGSTCALQQPVIALICGDGRGKDTFLGGAIPVQGETWSVGALGERYQRWWGEDHFGDGWVRKHGNSNTGERHGWHMFIQ